MIHIATQTFSTLFDAQHFIHPKDLKEKHDHDQPTLFRRILGVVLVALSIPFTLGIATVFFAYWAHRKVVHVKEQDRSDLDIRVAAAFPKAVKGDEKSNEQGVFEAALSALYRGDKSTLLKEVGKIEESQLTPDMKNAMIAAAISYDRVDEFDTLRTKFSSVNITLNEAKSPEMIAKIVDHFNGDKKAYVNQKYNGGNTALHHQHNLGVVRALLEKEASHLQNAEGQTPLHMCTDPKIAEKLIEHFGVDILEVKDAEGRTPLFTVPVEVKKVLIKKGSDVTATDDNGKTLLHYISESPLKDHPNFVKKILEKVPAEKKKTFVNKEDNEGSVALSSAMSLSVAKALVEAGAEYVKEGATSSLHYCEDPKLAEFLIKKIGKKILMQKDEYGMIPLVVNKNPVVLKVMIREMDDITISVDQKGHSILHYFDQGVLRDNPELVDKVLARITDKEKRKAFIDQVDNRGRIPLQYCLPSEVVKVLVEAGAEYVKEGVTSPLHYCEDPKLAEFLIEKFGKDILMQIDENEMIPLVVNQNPEVLKVMIREMDDITISVDSEGCTILHYFSESPLRDHPNFVKKILEKVKEDQKAIFVNTKDINGVVALSSALSLTVAKALVEAGAEYPKEGGKKPPLETCEDPKLAEFLIEKFGKDILVQKNNNGMIPLVVNKNPEVLKVMIREIEDITAFIDDEGDNIIPWFTVTPLKDHPELIHDVLAKITDKGKRKAFINKANSEGILPLHYKLPSEVVKALVEAGAEYVKEGATSPLHYCEDPKLAEFLIKEFGKKILMQKDENGRIPLVVNQNSEVLKVMIREIDDITISVDSEGCTILHYFDSGVLQDNPELVDAVLARIEDTEARTEFVNEPNNSGWTPLMYNMPLYVVKALLKAGAEYYVGNKGTHLHYCQDLENAQYLLDKYGIEKEHLERKDTWGRTPLMTQRNPDIVKLLIEKGANVEAVNGENGFQPLFYAKSVEEAQALIQRGAKLDVKATKGRSVLFGMISPQVAQWLIDDNGFNVLDTDEEGNQPIHCLGNFDSNVELAKVLIGNRDKDHDWQGNKPAILENSTFKAWLKAGKPSFY